MLSLDSDPPQQRNWLATEPTLECEQYSIFGGEALSGQISSTVCACTRQERRRLFLEQQAIHI